MQTYFPHLARLQLDGSIDMPLSGIAGDGERWDGTVHVLRDDPRHEPWMATMNSYLRFNDDTPVDMSESGDTTSVRITHMPTLSDLGLDRTDRMRSGSFLKLLAAIRSVRPWTFH